MSDIERRWSARVKTHKEAHRESWGTAFYGKWQRTGEEKLTVILNRHGEETLERLLDGIQGLSLTTQLHFLELGTGEDVSYLVRALDLVYPANERKVRKYQYDHYLQGEHHRRVLDEMLKLKFPNQDINKFTEALSATSSVVEAVEIALAKGPDYMLDAFGYIPPEQVSKKNFDRRLEIEKRARETKAVQTERKYRVRGNVQDVGFRGFCQARAKIWGITGFARNEFDGSVTLCLQGYPEIQDAYMESLETDVRRDLEISGLTGKFIEQREITAEYPDFQALWAERPSGTTSKTKRRFTIFSRKG